MALYHDATVTPTKSEMIEAWLPTQEWCLETSRPIDLIGAFRFDDPEGRVGLETHLAMAGETLFQVPLVYRGAPLDDADSALIGEMEHTTLGTRWVYDGFGDPLYLSMLAAVAMTGQGEAIGMVKYGDRWFIAPAAVRIRGGGWSQERVDVDGFARATEDDTSAVFRNDGFELTVHRQPKPGIQPEMGLTATWLGQPTPVVLAEVRATNRL